MDASGHFFAEVAGEVGGFVAADDVCEIHDHADRGFMLFGVVGREDGFAGVGVDEKLNVVVAENVIDLAHEGAEAVEVIDEQEVEFVAGGGFEEVVQGFDLFFGVVEGNVFGARFAGDDVFTGRLIASGRDEFASLLELNGDGYFIGRGLGGGADSRPDGSAHF